MTRPGMKRRTPTTLEQHRKISQKLLQAEQALNEALDLMGGSFLCPVIDYAINLCGKVRVLRTKAETVAIRDGFDEDAPYFPICVCHECHDKLVCNKHSLADWENPLSRLDHPCAYCGEVRPCVQCEAPRREAAPSKPASSRVPIPDYADVMPLAEYERNKACFSDDDGTGYYATATEMDRNAPVSCTGFYEAPAWATHVAWFNK